MKFVLGSGIVGMVVSFYLKDFMVLTKGRGQDGFRMGPKIIRKTIYTDSFIKKLNRKIKTRPVASHVFECSYSVNGRLKKELSEEEIIQYITKTRGHNQKVDIERFKSSALNDGLTFIEGYYMDEVYNALSSIRSFKTRRLFLDIEYINTKKHRIEGKNPSLPEIELSYNYSHLFNTLPAHLFNSFITKEAHNLHNSEIIIYIIKSEKIAESLGTNSFVYFVDKNIPYYRITKIGKDLVSVESKVLFFPKKVFRAKHKVINTIRLPYGKITDDIEPRQGINIKHIGRYAKNNNSLRVHDVIEQFEKGEIEL